jgi:serine/threonine protein kinase
MGEDVSSPKQPTVGPVSTDPKQVAAGDAAKAPAPDSKPTPYYQGPTVDSVVIPEAAAAALPQGEFPSIPGYEILGVLGRGGMGVVYKAMQTRLKRAVALKVIRIDSKSTDSTAVKRFQREALSAAQLFHPNVVVVFDFDQVDDIYFIAMEFVPGTDLHQIVRDQGPLALDRACDYIRQAALGLQHAAERGLVHRDIKPSNLLVTAASNPTAQNQDFGVLKILDMGLALARDLPNQSFDCTQIGVLMGTPDYLAPEQALDSHAVDMRSDLYSLGCTFYYLLTGKAPFGDAPLMKKLMLHQTGEPRPIEELRSEVPSELAAIVRKLMAKQPDQRYQTPAQLIGALTELTTPTKKATPRPEGDSSVQLADKAAPAATAASPDSTLMIAGSASTHTDSRSERGHADRIAVLEGHRGWVTSLAFTADRKTLVSGGVDGTVRTWTMSSSKGKDTVLPRTHAAEVAAVAVSPDSSLLASGCGAIGGFVSLWDLSTPEPSVISNIACAETAMNTLVFSPASRYLAGAGSDGIVRVWEARTPAKLVLLKGHATVVNSLSFASDEQTVVSGSQDGTVRLWNITNFWSKKQAVLDENWGPVRTVAFNANSKLLALGCLDQSVRLWELPETGPQQRAVLSGHTGVPRLVYFNRDGATLISVCDGGRIILWNLVTAAKEREWLLPRQEVYNSFALTHDGRYLAASNSEGKIHLYRLYPRRDRKS